MQARGVAELADISAVTQGRQECCQRWEDHTLKVCVRACVCLLLLCPVCPAHCCKGWCLGGKAWCVCACVWCPGRGSTQ